jgi:hypothetical protein
MHGLREKNKSLEGTQIFFSKWNSECLAKGE